MTVIVAMAAAVVASASVTRYGCDWDCSCGLSVTVVCSRDDWWVKR